MYEILITRGKVVDPHNNVHGRLDLAIADGKIVGVAPKLSQEKAHYTIDAAGKLVIPGLIDLHVHLCEPFGGPQGFYMMAKAGVTCALDLAGRPEALVKGLADHGTGMTVGFVFPFVPGDTVSGESPDRMELERIAEWAVEHGAIGVKVLGGHYPLDPDTTVQIIRMAHAKRIWCAIHAGTTVTGSNIEGLEELVDLADGLPMHVAHINSYCRGQKTGDALTEVTRALRALANMPQARSESYLALINGADASMEKGIPKSNVVKTCLQMRGYSATESGMKEAIREGWAIIQRTGQVETQLLGPEEGLEHFTKQRGRVGISFPINPPSSAIALALSKTDGRFTVTALSTDGGSIPRNTTLRQGLALVHFGALSLDEFVEKACYNPARMLGFDTKGHLGFGACGDVVVVDPHSASVEHVVAGGQIIVRNGNVVGKGGRVMTTEAGQDFLRDQGVDSSVINPPWL